MLELHTYMAQPLFRVCNIFYIIVNMFPMLIAKVSIRISFHLAKSFISLLCVCAPKQYGTFVFSTYLRNFLLQVKFTVVVVLSA